MIEVEAIPFACIIRMSKKLAASGKEVVFVLVMLWNFMSPISTFQTTVNVVVSDLIQLEMAYRTSVLKHCPVPATVPLTLVG